MNLGVPDGNRPVNAATLARWQEVARVVDLALDLEAADRPELLERTCSGDAALRGEVERLLAATERAADFLDQPVAADAAPLVSWVERRESQTLASGTRFSAYEVTGLLGRGGMATVYLARDHKHHRTVAVKVFDAGVGATIGREWFLREIDIAAGLHHPHILPLHDSGEVDGRLYYVMPHVEGESLRQRLSREGRIPLASVRRIVQEVAGALDYAHRQHVVHRDIKPENILLQEGQAIVADFGIARALDPGVVDVGSAETIPALGTPAYMSPEQATRTTGIDGRADIYALGCVVYEMLAGAPPFTGATVQAILEQHAASPVPSLRGVRPDLPLALEQAVTRALQKAPADRFATAGEFVTALDRAASAAAPERSAAQVPRLVFLGVVAAVVLTVTLILLIWRPSRASRLDPSLVAILPFRIAGSNPELTWLREGLVDLLAIKLAGDGGLSVAEPRAVLSAWNRAAGSSGQKVTPEAALAIARGLGAGRVIDGSVVGPPGHLTLTASLLNTPDGRSTARASVEGPADSLATLVDRLTARLLSEEAGVHTSQVASLASTSLPAIRAYLAGRAAFRKGDWDEAFRQFHQATLLDSTFVLAALEVVHASYYAASYGESREAGRAKRLAQAGRERLGPGDQALLDVWAAPYATAPVLFQRWQTASKEYPDRAEIWYGLGDAYYHDGMFAGLVDPLRLAAGAFQRAWALDSANGTVSVSPEGSPMLTHMVEIAQVGGDTASVRRLARLRLDSDSSGSQGWYLRWHQAVTLGDSARRAFWADSQQMEPETFTLIHRFTASAGVATQDYQRAADLMIRQWEVGDPDGAAFARHVVALNGGRPREATRVLPAVLSTGGVSYGLPIREALYWGGDTNAAVEAARRLVPLAKGDIAPGEASMDQLQSLCALATWSQARGEYRYADTAVRRLRTAAVAGLPADDSIAVTQYTTLCAALLDAVSATELQSIEAPAKLERADSAARSFIVGQSLAANLVIARVAEAQGDLHLALRAVRRRAGRYNMLPTWYLSSFLREEGRLAGLTGDTAGAIRAYQHFLMLRSDPEPEMREGTERVRAELAKLMRQRGS
jgi:eukaryotic-like serine/threonine-protein kinase